MDNTTPIILKPKRNWLFGRKQAIIEAVSKCNQIGQAVPFEWSDEYLSICVQIAQIDAREAIKTWKQPEF